MSRVNLDERAQDDGGACQWDHGPEAGRVMSRVQSGTSETHREAPEGQPPIGGNVREHMSNQAGDCSYGQRCRGQDEGLKGN